MTKTLKEWREDIHREVNFVDIKIYSHNIISIALRAIAKNFGASEANKAIEDFGLETLGWHKQSEGMMPQIESGHTLPLG